MKKTAIAILAVATAGLIAPATYADNAYQVLPFAQDWTNIGLITADDNWSGVPGIVGFRGDNLTVATGVNPQTVLGDDLPGVPDINANQTNPITFISGGCTEYELANPVVALAGSGTADAPYLVLHVSSAGKQNVIVRYTLRDLENVAPGDSSVQQFALQFRTVAGTWTNVPAGYVADATSGPTQVPAVTLVNVTLPAAADNAATLQIRIMTTNAPGNDEATGIDDISVSAEDIPVPTASTSWGLIKAAYRK